MSRTGKHDASVLSAVESFTSFAEIVEEPTVPGAFLVSAFGLNFDENDVHSGRSQSDCFANATGWHKWENYSSGGSNNNNSNASQYYSTWQIVVLATLAGVTSVVTIGGNFIVILSFIVERAIRQPTNYFIASLAVSDLLIGSVSMPFYTVYLLAGQRWPLGEILCDLWLSLDYTVCLCSIYTVLCITIDRFCSVKIPARYRDWRTENKVLAMIAVTWAVPVLVFFTSIFGWQYFVGERTVPEGKCYVQYMEAALFNCLLQVGYFWITLTIMFALYTGIYQVVLNLSRKSDAKQKKLTTMAGVVGTAMQMRAIVVDDDNNRPDKKRNTRRPTLNRSENSATSDEQDESPDVAKQTRRSERLFPPPSNRFVDAVDPDGRKSPVPSDAGSNKGGELEQNTSCSSRFSNGDGLRGGGGGTGSMETLVRNGNDESSKSGTAISRVGFVIGEATDSAPLLSHSGTSIQLYDAIDASETLAANEASTTTQTPGQSSSAGQAVSEWHSAGCRETLQVPGRVPMASDCRESHKNSGSVGDPLASKLTPDGRRDSIVALSIRRCSYSPGAGGNSKWTHRQSLRLRGATERLAASSSENRARKALRTITVILGAFVLCWTPWHVLSMVISYCPPETVCVNPLLYDVSYWLCYLNSPINPLCYALANQQFKKTFIRILKFDFHRT